MKDNHGQALIEFIIIIPVLLFILFAIVDIGNIIYQKYKLENDIDTISEMYKLNKTNDINSYINNINAQINFEKNDKYTIITLEKKIIINTIGLNNIIGKKYKISVSKTILNGDIHEQ